MSSSLIESIFELGWDLLIHFCRSGLPPDGMILSPLSITIALGMLAGGAGPAQRGNFSTRLGISVPAKLSKAFKYTQEFLRSNTGHSLETANAVFAENDFNFKSAYKDFLAEFAAEIVQFPNLPDATDEINEWISDHTRGLIQNMLDRGFLRDAQVVLINALAFKGTWQDEFDPHETQKGYAFHITKEETRPVDMMFRYQQKIAVSLHEHFTAISLPYKVDVPTRPMHFVAYLPTGDKTVQELLPKLNLWKFPKFEIKVTTLGLPKFKLETTELVTDVLMQLGYPLDGTYPEMCSGQDQATVDLILHRAFINVDEEGTEAAAVTVIRTRGLPLASERPKIIVFDRPFAFSIIEESGMALFTGVFTKQ